MPISITITADTPRELRGWLDTLAGYELATSEPRGALVGSCAGFGTASDNTEPNTPATVDANDSPAAGAAQTEPEPAEKPKRRPRAAKTEPTIPATAEAYEAVLGEPQTGVAPTAASGPETSTSAPAETVAPPSSDEDLAVVRTRVQGKLRDLALTPGSGGRATVAEVLAKINGGNVGAMTCPAENLPALEAEVDSRLGSLKAAG